MRRNVFDFDTTSVLIDDFLHDSQSQACAACFGRDIGFERARQHLCRKAMAVVTHRQFDAIAAAARVHADLRRAGIGRGILRILQQVVDDLSQLAGVAVDVRQVGRQLPFDTRCLGFVKA